MTHRAEPPEASVPDVQDPEVTGAEMAAGVGVMFAAVMMIVNGIFQVFQGVAALLNEEFFVSLPNYVITVDVSTWGWVHLVLGALVAIAGFYLLSGSRAAAIFALVLAVLSTIGNFAFIPFYPFWALLLIALDVYIIWAIASSGILEREPTT
jgi:hypothetical protein